MASRKKPIGEEWLTFVDEWYNLDHSGKLSLCSKYGVTYDTARHWLCEGNTTPPPIVAAEPAPEPELNYDEVAREFLEIPCTVDLDFVAFDIETTGLEADFSVILCACIKPFGKEAVTFRSDHYPKWLRDRSNDMNIVIDIANELSKHAIVLTHYGSKFDVRYLRAKMARYALPPLPPMFGVDTYTIAKQNFKVSRRRLETLGEYFGLGKKSPVTGNLWMKAGMNGDRAALDAIVAHCQVDVALLERLGALSFPYLKSIPKL